MDEQKESHESYGMLRIGRVTGHDKSLFGSSIQHHNTIWLTINPGVVERSLHHDHYYANRQSFIEVEMSQSQFAEAITSMNVGSGVPVTIRRVNGESIDDPPFTSKRLQFEQEFKQRMERLESRLSNMTEDAEDALTNKKSLTKNDRKAILNDLTALKREVSLSLPFIAKSFNEQMDKTAQEAKAEVEAFTINKLNQLGMEKVGELQGQGQLPYNEDHRPLLPPSSEIKQE
ncbi:hypothetical protein RKD55_004638 [Rossellomorea marisflavi]